VKRIFAPSPSHGSVEENMPEYGVLGSDQERHIILYISKVNRFSMLLRLF